MGERLLALGVPIVEPVGGHAIFVDARAWLPHIPPLGYPGQSLAVALYEHAGIRSCEIGTVMFGRRPDGSEEPAAMDLVRLAFPRRVYTQSHADYVWRPSRTSRRTGTAARVPDHLGTAEPASLHRAIRAA